MDAGHAQLMNRNSERIPRRFCLTAVLREQRGGVNFMKPPEMAK
jgi:hypothetical protein